MKRVRPPVAAASTAGSSSNSNDSEPKKKKARIIGMARPVVKKAPAKYKPRIGTEFRVLPPELVAHILSFYQLDLAASMPSSLVTKMNSVLHQMDRKNKHPIFLT